MLASVIKLMSAFEAPVGSLVAVGPSGALGVVLQFTRRYTFIGMLDPLPAMPRDLAAVALHRVPTLPEGAATWGRTLDALGRSCDGGPRPTAPQELPFGGLPSRAGFYREQTIATGMPLVDVLFPLTTGIVRAIVGPRRSGRTTFALDLLAAAARERWRCILVHPGPSERTLALRKRLDASGALPRTTVLSAPPEHSATLRWMSLAAALSLAKNAYQRAEKVLLVVLDLDALIDARAELSHALGHPLASDGAPMDLRQHLGPLYEHARNPWSGNEGALTVVATCASETPTSREFTQMADLVHTTDPELRALKIHPAVALDAWTVRQWHPSLPTMRDRFARKVHDALLSALRDAHAADEDAWRRACEWTSAAMSGAPGVPVALDDALTRALVAAMFSGDEIPPEERAQRALQAAARVHPHRTELASQWTLDAPAQRAALQAAVARWLGPSEEISLRASRSAYRD